MPAAGALPLEFGSLYDDTVDVAWRMLARLGIDDASLEDAVQDVFVIAHRRMGEFRGESKPSTWIAGIAVRVAHDYRRRGRRKPTEPLEPHAERFEDPSPGPDAAVSITQAAEVLTRLLTQLDPDQREVFVLTEFEEQTAPQIADLTGVPLNTVYSRLRLARAHFNELVEAVRRGDP